MEYKSSSLKETETIGKDIAATLRGGDVLLLSGDLGAGKTALTKAIAKGLGIEETITSPTFTLMNLYQLPKEKHGIRQLLHVDTYRLEDEDELREIGIEDYLGDEKTICVIEWPKKMERLVKNIPTKKITIETQKNEMRNIVLT